ncbi:Histidine kinase [Hymenobacter daecheongensis DSM 21074]|uniref:Histidine kinase n=1 Tax=Hymenobacter daecheongensis DSM 21074 TaxID=1121955 RepID=A0A1M6FCX5_9BACT|nr:histidine kinase [Hymenobacter daecheongensis]SHI95503.1 Histidine kinase [Hymenobacter daecheongensis DSM 21074]
MFAASPRTRLYWTLQLIGWPLYGVAGAVLIALFAARVGMKMREIIIVEATIAVTMLVFSHLLRLYIRHHAWVRLSVGQMLPRVLLANAVVSVLSQVAILVLLVYVIRLYTGSQYSWQQFGGYVLNTYFVLLLWSAFYFGLHYLDSYKQAEIDKWKLSAAVREAEMRTLKAQINPHFMFNGLNNIRALVTEDPARARDMITHLSDLLRYSIQLNSAEQVPLSRELEIVTHYLALEAVQLEERLTYTIDAEPAALPVLIPPMTLQLLVENGIKHGIAPRPAGGHIHLTARLGAAPDQLLITVTNTGHYAPTAGYEGVGLRNAQERLHLLFGPKARLTVGNSATVPATVVAELELPVGSVEG